MPDGQGPSPATTPARLVLVVEDHPTTRKLLRMTLEADGFRVLEAPDGATAIRLAAQTPPDAVLQDLALPDMPGRRVAQTLRGLMPPGTPILAVTSLDGEEAGDLFVRVVRKPIETGRLIALLHTLLPDIAPPPARHRVLVLDDDPLQRKLACLQLEADGFETAAVGAAAEVGEAVRRFLPDVILADVMMPGTDGFEFCAAARRDPALCDIPIVLISGIYIESGDQALALRSGAHALVPRTTSRQALRAALAAAIVAGAQPADDVRALRLEHEQRVAAQLATHVRTLDHVRRHLAVQAAINEATAAVSAAIARRADTASALQGALNALTEVTGIRCAGMFELSGDAVTCRLHVGFEGMLPSAAVGEALADLLRRVAGGDSVRTMLAPETACLPVSGLQSAALAPLQFGGASLGVLVLASEGPEFADADWRAFAGTLAAHVAQALSLDAMVAHLESSERRWRTVLEQANDAVVLLSPDGRVVEFNRRFAELAAADPDGLRGARFLDLLAPSDTELAARLFATLVEWGSVRLSELEIARHDGTWFYIDVSAAMVEVGGERLAVCILRDATEQTRAAAELRRSESRYRALIESVATLVWTMDAEGATGVPDALFTGRPAAPAEAAESVAPADRARVAAAWRQAVDTAAPVEVDFRLRDSTNAWHDYVARVVPIRDARGTVVEWVGSRQDVTETKALERQLQHAQRMEAIGQLTGGIAHDFNNMLTAILGFAQIVSEQMPADSPSLADVMQIRRAAESAAALTRQLLAFSRQQVREVTCVNVSALLADLDKLLRRLLGEHIALSVDARPDLKIAADVTQVQQIVMNLAVNARDAMPGGGTLAISAQSVGLAGGDPDARNLVPPGRYVRIDVRDTGCGMPEEVRQHIFEPFFTTKPPGHGTGLGLATVYGGVKQSNGFVFVESTEGQGTTFTIYLPEVEGESLSSREAGAAADRAPGTGVILLAEDDPGVRRLASVVLRQCGYTVLDAATPHEAVDLAGRHDGPIDLLLTDVIMPGMSGLELAMTLGARTPGLRTLFMSGYLGTTLLAQQALPADARVLPKPFLPQALTQKVREVLAS